MADTIIWGSGAVQTPKPETEERGAILITKCSDGGTGSNILGLVDEDDIFLTDENDEIIIADY